jgi:hypothetical protein
MHFGLDFYSAKDIKLAASGIMMFLLSIDYVLEAVFQRISCRQADM